MDVLVELLRALPMTHLVQLQTPNDHKNLPSNDFWSVINGDDSLLCIQLLVVLHPTTRSACTRCVISSLHTLCPLHRCSVWCTLW